MKKHTNEFCYSELAELESKHWEDITFDGKNILSGQEVLMQWANHPVVKIYTNICQTGEPGKDWLNFLLEHFKRFNYGCSIGCGSGWVEQILVKNNIVENMDCFDISEGAIEEAIKTNAYPQSLHFAVQDCNKIQLQADRYDLILFHHSFHHLLGLEHIIETIAAALSDKGIVVMVDYIGETRGQWEAGKIDICKFVLKLMPEGVTKEISSFDQDFFRENPFEMIRSSETLPLMNARFSPIWQRNMGGVLYPLNNTIVSAIQDKKYNRFIILACIFDVLFNERIKPCFTFSIFVKKNNTFKIGAEDISKEKIVDFLIGYGLNVPQESGPWKESEFEQMVYELSKKESVISAVRDENTLLRKQLIEVYETIGWRILTKIRYMRDNLFPSGTRRGNIYQRFVRSIKKKN